jgi:hypothetical protein
MRYATKPHSVIFYCEFIEELSQIEQVFDSSTRSQIGDVSKEWVNLQWVLTSGQTTNFDIAHESR